MSSEQYNSAFTGQQIDEAINKVQNQAPILAGTAQTLTDEQKVQARKNIGAISDTELAEELAKRGQLAPEFANSVEECTDPTKLYVLPDGYIYAYMKHKEEVVIPGETVITPAKAVIYPGYRYSHSSGKFSEMSGIASLIVPLPVGGVTSATVELTNVTRHASYTGIYAGETNTLFPNNGAITTDGLWNTAKTKLTMTASNYDLSGANFIVFFLTYTNDAALANVTITLDGTQLDWVIGQPSEARQENTTTTEGSTEIIETEGFVSTGHAFVPADYEDRILELEDAAEGIAENTAAIAENTAAIAENTAAIAENTAAVAENTERIEILEEQVGTVDENAAVHNAVGTTYPPAQKPAATEFDGYDIDVLNATADEIHAYIDEVVNGKETITKEIMGKDESGNYDIARYIFARREHCAWQRQNYPKMYAWQNGSTVIYSVSVSPRIGDTMYSTEYIGTAYSTVTAVSATNRSRTVNSLEFVRYESGDIEPTVIYTDADDDRNSGTSITQDGVTYNRYPLGDLGANRAKLTPIFIYANEHGIVADPSSTNNYETKMCALVAARFLRDVATGKQGKNPLYKYIRENCMLIVIPVANPFGYNMNVLGGNSANSDNGYLNANRCNINRNYDTPGWDVMTDSATLKGTYPGSQNETQYVMNTMVESGAVVAMSLHGLGGWAGYCAHQGQSPDGSDYDRDKLANVSTFLTDNYGYILRYYDLNSDGTPAVAVNTPDITSKSPSYITQCGAYGGIVEFQPDDVNTSGFLQEMKSNVIENAYAQTLNLMAMWLSDYLEA